MQRFDVVAVQRSAERWGLPYNAICIMCLGVIKVTAFKGTHVCSENCRKDRDNDHTPASGMLNEK